MGTRYRWFRIGTDFDFHCVLEKISAVRFSAEADDWFSLAESEAANEIRFYWRTVVTTSYIDDSNEQVYQSVPTLAVLEFSLIEGQTSCYIRIKNPPRTVAVFMNALERILGFGFCVEAVNILIRGRDELLRHSTNARLVSVKATNVKLGENVLGRVEAVSKEFISEDLLGKFSMYPHLIDFCTYEIIHKNLRGQVSFYRNGQIRASDNVGGYVIEMIEGIL